MVAVFLMRMKTKKLPRTGGSGTAQACQSWSMSVVELQTTAGTAAPGRAAPVSFLPQNRIKRCEVEHQMMRCRNPRFWGI